MALTTAQQDLIIKTVVGVFDAAPGATYLNLLAPFGSNQSALVNALVNTDGFKAIYPDFYSNEQFATKFLDALVGSTVNATDKANVAAYAAALLEGGASRANVVLALINALDNVAYTDATWGAAAKAFDNQAIVAKYYTIDQLGSATSIATLQAVTAGVTNTTDVSTPAAIAAAIANSGTSNGQSFTLTTGIDTLTGAAGNDTFVATKGTVVGGVNPSTLNAGDSVDGGAGTDTLKIVVSDTAVTGAADQLAGVTLSSIENVTVQNAAGIIKTFDFTAAQGVSTVTSLNATAGSTVAFTNLATGAKVVASGPSAAAGINFTLKTAGDAVSVAVDNGVSGQTIAATAGNATAATISSTGAANGFAAAGADVFTLTAAAATIKTLAVNAATNLKATLTGTDYAATGAALTVSGAATKVDLGTNGVFKSIDASGLTAGGLTITTSGAGIATSIVGGAGNDVVTLGAALSASGTVNLGAGNDTLKGAAAIPTAAVVDGGDGTDYISAALVNVGSAANVKNFEGLDVTGFNAPLDAALLTNSTIANVQFSGAAVGTGNTAIIQNLAAAATVNVTGAIDQALVQTANLGSLTVTQTGTPTLAVNFAAAPGIAGVTAAPGGFFSSLGTVTETGNTAITIASGGDSFVVGNGINSLVDTSNKLTTVTITGDHAFTLGAVHTNSAATLAATTASSLTTIDGSAATGKLTITAGANDTITGQQLTYTGLTINGGSAADTISISAKNGVVNAGAGNDTINVAQNVAGTTSDVVTVNGGAGADTLASTLAYGQVATAASSATNGNLVFFADAASTDVIKFANVANLTGALGAKANVSAAATFDQAVFLADNGAAANTVTWFQYAGNTYIENVTTAVDSADNIVIKLSGLVDLSGAAVVTGANGTITLA